MSFLFGLVNIYQVLTVPHGTEFTICQVIMYIKPVQDLISPLYLLGLIKLLRVKLLSYAIKV